MLPRQEPRQSPYTLPVFNPLGNQTGESLSVKAIVALKQMTLQIKVLHVKLDRSILDALADPVLLSSVNR